MKKILAIGVILLFIGVAVAPSINTSVVKASNDNDLVEVTTQACGIQGYGNTTVKLTREQYNDLTHYLAEFRARLNQTSTRGEAVPIFKEAIVELNKYGLLPKGMSVERLQEVILHQTHQESLKSRDTHENENLLCLVSGQLTNAYFMPLIAPILLIIMVILQGVLGIAFSPILLILFLLKYYDLAFRLLLILFIPIQLIYDIVQILVDITNYSPFSFCNYLNNLLWSSGPPPSGWIQSKGLFGNKTWNGTYNLRIFCFTGLKLRISHYEVFFLGSALYIEKQDTEPWYSRYSISKY
jgi:hypothetical protein